VEGEGEKVAEEKAAEESSCFVELPTSAGSSYVAIQEVGLEEQNNPAEPKVETPRNRFQTLISEETGVVGALLRKSLQRSIRVMGNFVYGASTEEWMNERERTRRKTEKEDTTELAGGAISPDDAIIMNMRSTRALVNFSIFDDDIPPLTAEDAKAKATWAAQRSESAWIKMKTAQAHTRTLSA